MILGATGGIARSLFPTHRPPISRYHLRRLPERDPGVEGHRHDDDLQ